MFSTAQIYEQILFFDIETVSQKADFAQLDARMQALWHKKAQRLKLDPNESDADCYARQAGIFAEFNKIICISCGYLKVIADKPTLIMKSFSGDDERKILIDFAEMLQKWFTKSGRMLCAHNGREFDVPVLGRRMLIQKVPLPSILDIQGKKPWEVKFLIDTLEQWKFGDHKNYTSLDLIAACLGVPSPKTDMGGSQVSGVYWTDNDLVRIVRYCTQDVQSLCAIFLGMNGLDFAPIFDEASATTPSD